jgi:hypothetical protein
MWTLLSMLAVVLYAAGGWMLFDKAGQRGWIALIPIVNWLGGLKMVGLPFWCILFFIPPLTPVSHFVLSVMVARRFGKSALFGVGMAIFPMFFVPIVGFGGAKYLGPGQA